MKIGKDKRNTKTPRTQKKKRKVAVKSKSKPEVFNRPMHLPNLEGKMSELDKTLTCIYTEPISLGES